MERLQKTFPGCYIHVVPKGVFSIKIYTTPNHGILLWRLHYSMSWQNLRSSSIIDYRSKEWRSSSRKKFCWSCEDSDFCILKSSQGSYHEQQSLGRFSSSAHMGCERHFRNIRVQQSLSHLQKNYGQNILKLKTSLGSLH